MDFVVEALDRRFLLRINIQVSDAATAEYRWAGRYEFDPDELGSGQPGSPARSRARSTRCCCAKASRRALTTPGIELGLNDCLAQGTSALKGEMRAEPTAEAQRWFLAALALDPRNVEALTGLAKTCQHLVGQPWWGDSGAATVALDLGQQAITTALELAPGHAVAKSPRDALLCGRTVGGGRRRL